MKIERRDYTVFMAHEGVSIFFNRYLDPKTRRPFFMVRVNKGLHGVEGNVITQWITITDMRVEQEQLKDFLGKLEELVK